MALTVNDDGVLRTLGAISVNDGGVIRNLSSVSTNDGGVIKEVFSSDKFEISGITPLVVADDHVVIVEDCTGTISLPAGARIIVGCGGVGTLGGYVSEYTLMSGVKNAAFTVTLKGSTIKVNNANSDFKQSKITIAGKEYVSSTIYNPTNRVIIQTKWGPVGGDGGVGEFKDYTGSDDDESTRAEDGTGAGGGGAGHSASGGSTKGGNNEGYGNYGGNGGRSSSYPATDGASGKGHRGEGGGGGGYAAGGGGETSYEDEDGTQYLNNNGEAGAGIIVIEW